MGLRGRLLLLLLFLASCGEMSAAHADGMRFFLEHNYTLGEISSRDADGTVSDSETRGFSQKYRLSLDRRIFPNLTFRGGGLFEKSDSRVTGDTDLDSEITEISPFVDLTLATPLYSAGVGYSRRQIRQESRGEPASALIRETYSSALSWRPAGLPAFSLQYTQSDTHDRHRIAQDDASRRLLFGADYKPDGKWILNYQGSFSRTEDRLNRLEVDEQSHSGRVTYADRLWRDRISLFGSYIVSFRRTGTVVGSSGGEVPTLLPGEAAGAVDANPSADLSADDVRLEIGVPALGPSDLTLRHLGVKLLEKTEVNALHVSVDTEIAETAVDLFGSWQVYYLTGEGSPWLDGGPAAVVFNRFDKRFELRFPTVQALQVKVVMTPVALSPPMTGEAERVTVTNVQALHVQSAADVEGENSVTSHQVSLSSRTRILADRPLYYDFSLLYSTSDQQAGSRLFFSNGLSLQHVFTPWLNGTTQVGRDDTYARSGDIVSYRYGFSLTATPLRPLTHTLSYSGRYEEGPELSSRRNSLFLNNRARLYRGIDVLLNGGVTFTSLDTGEESRSTLFSVGAVLTPHRAMTWNLSYSEDRSASSGGNRRPVDSLTRRGRFSVSCNPLPAVNLFLSLEAVEQDEVRRTLQNYAVNWSPLRDGALQFGIAFNETLRPEEDALDRLLVPSVRWEIRPGTFLELSYSIIDSESDRRSIESRYFNALLRTSF